MGSGLLVDDVKLESNSVPEPPVNVPEPASGLGLLAFGAFGAASVLKRKKQQQA